MGHINYLQSNTHWVTTLARWKDRLNQRVVLSIWYTHTQTHTHVRDIGRTVWPTGWRQVPEEQRKTANRVVDLIQANDVIHVERDKLGVWGWTYTHDWSTRTCWDFPGGPVVKNPAANAGDTDSIPGPTWHGTPGPGHCNNWARALEPALQQEKPPQWEAPGHGN